MSQFCKGLNNIDEDNTVIIKKSGLCSMCPVREALPREVGRIVSSEEASSYLMRKTTDTGGIYIIFYTPGIC